MTDLGNLEKLEKIEILENLKTLKNLDEMMLQSYEMYNHLLDKLSYYEELGGKDCVKIISPNSNNDGFKDYKMYFEYMKTLLDKKIHDLKMRGYVNEIFGWMKILVDYNHSKNVNQDKIKMVDVVCLKYTTQIRYHSTCHDILEIFIPTFNVAFHYVNTIVGKILMVIETPKPRSEKTESVLLSSTLIDKIMQIHKNRTKINQLESEIKDQVDLSLYSQTVMFDDDPTTEQLKKEVVELTEHSKSKVNTMTLAELKDIVAEYH